jgi:hypothetical protein
MRKTRGCTGYAFRLWDPFWPTLTVVEKSVRNKCQSKTSTPATPCLCNHNREHAFYSNCSSGGHTDVATSCYLNWRRSKTGDLQTELFWRIYSSKIRRFSIRVAIFSGSRGQNRSYYFFRKKVLSWTSSKKLLAKPGNVGNLAMRFSTYTVHYVKTGLVLGCLQTDVYMQSSPVLTTVGAQTCIKWPFVYVLIARLRCWLYPHIHFCLNFYTSSGYHCNITLITTGWDWFGSLWH